MYRAYARILSPDGVAVDLCAGDIIGRHHSAALRLDDPRISEMHAYLSLRRGGLFILALRGRLQVGGMPVTEVRAEPGLELLLETDLELTVQEVQLPDEALAMTGWGEEEQRLEAPVLSLVDDGDSLQTVPSWLPDAAAWVWRDGAAWRMKLSSGTVIAVSAGTEMPLRGHELRFFTGAPSPESLQHTVAGGLFAPLRMVVRYDTAHIHRERQEPVLLSGFPARIVSELAQMGVPVHWKSLAGRLWRGETDALALRQRLDRNLATLRSKLREARVRPDLVRADGKGHYELFLVPGDEVVDES